MVAELIAHDGPEGVWVRICARLSRDLGAEAFDSWFGSMHFERDDNGTVLFSVPSRFLKNWISTHYHELLTSLWAEEAGAARRIEVIVRSAVRPRSEASAPTQPTMPPRAVPSSPTPAAVPMPSSQWRTADTTQRPASLDHRGTSDPTSSPLDARHTFANFAEGSTNRFALAAARQVADPASAISFNPLYIHASVGLGKTHLLQAIAHHVTAGDPRRRILYLTAEHFMYRFAQALQNQSSISFKETLRGIDLLLIDDVQFLTGKQMQQEFCHTLNSLIDGARRVVVAADRPPVDLESLDERVRSRLAGGLLVEISAPDPALRRLIVENRIAQSRQQAPNFKVPDDVIDYIVTNVTTSGRDLEGATTRLFVSHQLTGHPITLATAEAALKDLVRVVETKRIRIEEIQRVVAKHYNVNKADLLSNRRTRSIVWPRQIAMYLSKTLTPRSLPEIGRRFGNRDHTTVLHAVRKVEEMIQHDDQLVQELEILKRQLEL